MEVNYVGELVLGDMHAMHGYQVQPAYTETDILYTLGPQNMLEVEGVAWDRHHDCTHLQTKFVPFNQRVASTFIRDDGAFRKAGLPSVRWETLEMDGEAGSVTATLQEFPDSHWGFAYWGASVKRDEWGQTATLRAVADHLQSPAGVARPMAEREVVLYYSHHLFTKVDSAPAQVFVSVKIGGYWYKIDISALTPTMLSKSYTDGAGWTEIRSGVKGGSAAQVAGATGSNRLGEMVELRLKVMNARLTVSVGGSSATPVMIALAKDTRWGVLSVSGQDIRIPEGAASLLPPVPFAAHVWAGGVGTRQTLRPALVTGKNLVTDRLTVDGSLAGIQGGATFDILDPRIQAVEFSCNGFSSVAASLHPACYKSTGFYRRAPFQTGFVPNAATITGFTLHTDCEVGAARSGAVFFPELLPSVSVQPTISFDGAVASYALVMTGADKTGSPDMHFDSYQGEEYATDTPVLTRVSVRFEGQVEPPSSAFIRIPLGVGGENPLVSVTSSAAFDPSALTITSSASVELDNWHGLDYLQSQIGVGAFGNVGVGLRMGWLHQQFKAPYGQWGMNRFWGMSDTRHFQTPVGGGNSYMTLVCTDQMQQLGECLVAAPPDLDGHNHFWAMAFLAQLAGIPLSKMAFAHLVPPDPYGYSSYDSEPYFLPMGAGMHPWTPVNRTLSALALMDQIRKTTGFLMYFDAAGYLHYEPFSPAESYLSGVKRIFTATAFPSYSGLDWSGGLTEMSGCVFTSSVRDVRNQMLLIGVDSEHSWGVIGAKLEDTASISSPPGLQPINYKGYKSPMVWMDSRFANEGFALRSADRLYRWMRQPAVTVNIQCWPQWDLFPLDMIYVHDWRTGTLGIPFFIMSITNQQASHGRGSCSITARYLDPFLLG